MINLVCHSFDTAGIQSHDGSGFQGKKGGNQAKTVVPFIGFWQNKCEGRFPNIGLALSTNRSFFYFFLLEVRFQLPMLRRIIGQCYVFPVLVLCFSNI